MTCLTRWQLERTLDDEQQSLPEPWERHLASCAVCQAQLDTLAGSRSEWESACLALDESHLEFSTAADDRDSCYSSTIFYRLDWSSAETASADREDSGSKASDPKPPTTDNQRDDALADPQPIVAANLVAGIASLEPPSHPENLGRLGRYELEHPIGQGGMGIVFKGFDVELNRPVAIKILSPHLSGHGTARQRFTKEAQSAAAVVHDHVVPIYDIQSDHPQPFLVMPFVSGVSLETYVRREGQLGTRNLVQVGLQIASGLAAAHAQGLIHRDIKPANILLENGLNRVQITDFGLARAVDDAAMTHSGMIAGTPHYMSPEQATGATLDHRSDLFSLGCVMYFMATGRTLYRGDSPFAVIAQLCRGKYRRVRELNPDIPGFIEDIIDKLLEREPRERFQSADQVMQHLERSLAYLQQPTVCKPPRRLVSSRKRKDGIRVALGSLASLLLFAAIWWINSGTTKPPINPLLSDPAERSEVIHSWTKLDQELDQIDQQLLRLEVQLGARPEGLDGDHGNPTASLAKDPLWRELQQLQQELRTDAFFEPADNPETGRRLFPAAPTTQDQAGGTSEDNTKQHGLISPSPNFHPSMEKENRK